MSPDPENTSDDREPLLKKLFDQGPVPSDKDRAEREFLEAAEPHKVAAALRMMRRLIAGQPTDPAVIQEAARYLEERAPGRLETLLGGLESAVIEPGGQAGEAAEAELLELAHDTAALEAAGEEPTADALDRIRQSARAQALLETLRDLHRELGRESAGEPEAQYTPGLIPKLIHKAGQWVLGPEYETPQPGQRLGPWTLGEVGAMVPLSMELPEHEAQLHLQVGPEAEDYERGENWIYKVKLASQNPVEMEVGWGNAEHRHSGWEPLGPEPVHSMFPPPTTDPVWVYLRYRSGDQWLEKRQEIPMLKHQP